MTILIIIVLLVILVAGWVMSTQRRLVVMDENINNAMSQIGVQLSSRFDALTALLDLAKGYAAHESQTLIETIKSRRPDKRPHQNGCPDRSLPCGLLCHRSSRKRRSDRCVHGRHRITPPQQRIDAQA